MATECAGGRPLGHQRRSQCLGYIDQFGWRKVSPDNDNILFDMLAQLIAAKAKGGVVTPMRNGESSNSFSLDR